MNRGLESWSQMNCRWLVAAIAACVSLFGSAPMSAQGITTAAIRGVVRSPGGKSVDGAVVQIVNMATGVSAETRVRGASFLVQGLPIGGPYRITVRSIGHLPQRREEIHLALGETRKVDFDLVAFVSQLDTVTIVAADFPRTLPSAGGAGTSISDSSLRRLPTLNRDIYDFVRLVPHAGTRLGFTGGGANFRLNSYVIDGVSDRQLQGNNVLGPGTIGGKSISLEAVKEYQVLLSPYDARYGDFSGMLINAVTKSGTNKFHGSAYSYVRNERLARSNSFVGTSPYRREQFGFSLGGPIVRDKVHFFIAPEFDRATAPASGPYVSEDALPTTLPVTVDDINRFASILRANGLEAGNGDRMLLRNPSVTLFGRLDIALPSLKSRVVLRDNYSTVDVTRFARSSGGAVFPLSSNAWTLRTSKHTIAVQIFTKASQTAFNELVLSYMDRPLVARDFVKSPFIQAETPVRTGVGSATLIAGPQLTAGGSGAQQISFDAGDDLVVRLGDRHTLSLGGHVEFFRYRRRGVPGSFGQWRFSSLDALERGDASRYTLTKDFGSAEGLVQGAQPSAYITDEWRIADRLMFTVGMRAEALRLTSRPASNPAVDSVLQRRTSDYPRPRLMVSPRFGFTWEPFAESHTRIRGGAGVFTSRPPIGWLLGPIRSNGAGVRTLTCTGAVGSRRVPKFVADPSAQPQLCGDGSGFSDGPVALVDRNLAMAQHFRTSLAIDRSLPGGFEGSVEALYSRVRSDFQFINVNLAGPQSVDRHGRVMYGSTDEAGQSRPVLVGDGRIPEVIDLRNHSVGYSWSLTGQLVKSFTDRFELKGSYSYSRIRDLQSLTHGSAVNPFEIWASSRPLSVSHDDRSSGVSSFEIPHRIVLAATYAAPWKRWKTDISFYYVGESGTPFTFNDSTALGRGDLNADGTSANDPIYVPRSATDPSEIVFGGIDAVAQADAFERFIRTTPCLDRQRGKIVSRNSCRGPFVHTSNASLRQSLQTFRRHNISLQVDVFNLLNLLNSSWGQLRIPNAAILRHTGQTAEPEPRPIFFFDVANSRDNTQNLESGYQLQLSLRYGF